MRKLTLAAATASALALIAACGGSGSGNGAAGSSATPKQLVAAGATQAAYKPAVQQLYIAYFGRPADPGGETNFMSALAAMNAPTDIQALQAAYGTNAQLKTLIDSFGTSQESKDLYGSGDTRAFVTAVYNNVLGRAPDTDGLNFWAGAIDGGGLSKANAALSIMAGALANTTAQGLLDGKLVQNRVTVATNFTETLRTDNAVSAYAGNNAAASARTLLAGVDSSTVPATYQTQVSASVSALVSTANGWLNFGRDAQHSAQGGYTQTQSIARVVWQSDVDLQPQYTTTVPGGRPDLLTTGHYGSPVITGANTVIFPVRVTSAGTYRIEARDGTSGTLKWQVTTDYKPPFSGATMNPALAASGRVYYPGAGGRIYYRDSVDSNTPGAVQTAYFYGKSNYDANPTAYDNNVIVSTPLITDGNGTVYFGYTVLANSGLSMGGGVARVAADGTGTWISGASATGDTTIVRALIGAAPALSPDGKTLYAVVDSGASGSTLGNSYLVALDSTTLAAKSKVQLRDYDTKQQARISASSTSSVLVGPDGDVYFGVLGKSGTNRFSIGWLLHYDATLATQKTTGGFGWDMTPSIVPASAVPGYTGKSTYLLAAKYNQYYNGQHRMAILDPNDTGPDRLQPTIQVMKEVLSMLSPTIVSGSPTGELHEWCINTPAVDPSTKSVYMNSSDGYMYRWDLSTNTLKEKINLNAGYYQSYTPIAFGPDGKIYGINNAVLIAIGK